MPKLMWLASSSACRIPARSKSARNPDMSRLAERPQPGLHESPVFADKRDDVCDRADRDETEQCREGFRPRPPEGCARKCQCADQRVCDTDTGKKAEGVGALRQVRIDDRRRRRDRERDGVVIDDDHINAPLAHAGDLGGIADAEIDGDHDLHALRRRGARARHCEDHTPHDPDAGCRC